MTHKVHPKVFRIRGLADWESRWLVKKNFSKFLEEDFRIKEFLRKKLAPAGLDRIEIERFPGKIIIIISAARPGLILGRGGLGVDLLRRELEKKFLSKEFANKKQEIKLEIKEIRNPWLSANLVGQWVAQQIERRVPFRRVLKQAIEKVILNKEAQGVKIDIAGRLGGAEIARREWLKKGRLPRQNLRADIDYSEGRAYCTYGVIGIKVWIYKGEKF